MGQQVLVPVFLGLGQLGQGPAPYFRQLARGRRAVGASGRHPAFVLPLHIGHADHEEFVQIAPENAQKLELLQQGLLGVQRFAEHAGIEFQPADLAVDVQTGTGQVLHLFHGTFRDAFVMLQRGHGLVHACLLRIRRLQRGLLRGRRWCVFAPCRGRRLRLTPGARAVFRAGFPIIPRRCLRGRRPGLSVSALCGCFRHAPVRRGLRGRGPWLVTVHGDSPPFFRHMPQGLAALPGHLPRNAPLSRHTATIL